MAAVNKLSSSTIRLIGSTQVITSVYSVVKELVENSIDAGSTNIDIKLDDFGLDKIEVSDNGIGVKAVDVPFVAKRHFTSKLSSMDDLKSLETYGFRGEALGSLCAVANVTIITKTVADEISTAYTFDCEGNIKSSTPSHLGKGTTVRACHLFSNLPVRKQYYKSSKKKKDDISKVEDLVMVYGIIKPNLRITLKNGSDLIYQKLPMPDTKSVLHTVLTRQVASQLLYKEKQVQEFQGFLAAFLPKPGSDVKTMSRANSDRTIIVINDRPVIVKELINVLKRYYVNCHACDSSRYPVCYVSIKLPIEDVDVNCDPGKSTVFIRTKNDMCQMLEEILLEVYGPLDNVPPWHYSEASEKTDKLANEKVHQMPSPQLLSRKEKLNTAVGREISQTDINKNNTESHIDESKEIRSKHDTQEINNTEAEKNIFFDDNLLLDTERENQHIFTDGENAIKFTDDQTKPLTTNCTSVNSVNQETTQEPRNMTFPSCQTTPAKCAHGQEDTDRHNGGHTAESAEGKNMDGGREDHIAEIEMISWQKGQMMDGVSGKVIQPVQLLAPTSKRPGKRPLSPTSKELPNQPQPKQRSSVSLDRPLPPEQNTLPNMIRGLISTPTLRPCLSVVPPSQSKGKIPLTESKVNNGNKTSGSDNTAQAVNSQTEKKKTDTLQQRFYHAEQRLTYTMKDLDISVKHREESSPESLCDEKPVIVGEAKQCDAWLCWDGSILGILNTQRLGESILSKRLRANYKLPISSLEQPLALNSRNLSDLQLQALDRLRQENHTPDTFDITDERLVANGFDVKFHVDSTGAISYELFGLCSRIPTYNIDDLKETLDKLNQSPLSNDLVSLRPTKVIYYLQGEAARMASQSTGQKSQGEVQDMLDHISAESLKTETCLHQRPLFHKLFDFNCLLA